MNAVRLNHKTLKFRLIEEGRTVARVDEVEFGHTPEGPVTRGYSYTDDGRRVLDAVLPMSIRHAPMAIKHEPYMIPQVYKIGQGFKEAA